jgi:sulfur-carrier protein adenylyltransferase/sulfurtransferase
MIPDVGLEGQRKLKAASVLLIGTGGLGSPVALYLAAAGIGRIGLVDYDVVDSSNLQRQVIHGTSTVGKLKVESARDRMADINPYIKIDIFNDTFSSENAFSIANGYDVIVDGTDNFPTRYLINDLCVLTGRPFVYGSIFRFEGQASVFDAQKGPCYRCLFPEPPEPGLVPSCADGGVLGVLPGTIGTIQATEVIKLILGIGTGLIGKLLLYDALDMTFQTVKLRKNPKCKICGENPVIDHLIDYEAYCGTPVHAVQSNENEISAKDLAEKMAKGIPLQLLDVREAVETQISKLPGAEVVSYWQLSEWMKSHDNGEEIVTFCRTGVRGGRAAALLRKSGFLNVWSLRGGINAWAADVDPEMNIY